MKSHPLSSTPPMDSTPEFPPTDSSMFSLARDPGSNRRYNLLWPWVKMVQTVDSLYLQVTLVPFHRCQNPLGSSRGLSGTPDFQVAYVGEEVQAYSQRPNFSIDCSGLAHRSGPPSNLSCSKKLL